MLELMPSSDVASSHGIRTPGGQRGYSLVELSIAVTIALFLIAGLLSLTQNTRRTYGTQNQLAQLQDTQRLGVTLITDVIQQAGYFPDPLNNSAAAEFPVVPGSFATAGQTIVGAPSGTPQGDTITIRYVSAGGDGVMNCVGASSPGAQSYVNTFSVDAASELQCAVNGANPVTLVSGVQSMTILYGVKTDFTVNDNRVDSYLAASEMTAASWGNVMSIRVTLSFLNPLYGQPGQTQRTIPFTRVIAVMNKAGVQT